MYVYLVRSGCVSSTRCPTYFTYPVSGIVRGPFSIGGSYGFSVSLWVVLSGVNVFSGMIGAPGSSPCFPDSAVTSFTMSVALLLGCLLTGGKVIPK